MTPSVGRIVHYVSHGTPVRPDGSQAYTSQCRAAIVTAVNGHAISPATGEEAPEWDVALCVLNPTGLFFHEHVVQDEGRSGPADPDCPNPHEGGPHRYCACGWYEFSRSGGTWHWPCVRVEG